MEKSLETNRLIMAPWKGTKEEARGLYNYAKNPNVGPSAGWKPHESVKESRRIIKKLFRRKSIVCFKIILKETSEIIGSIGCEEDKRRAGIKSLEMGYALAEEHWGKGYMPEAASILLDYIFEEKNLDIVSICTNVNNHKSQKVIEKLGFVYEGTERFAWKSYDESIMDVKVYSLLNEEWIQAKRHLR